MVIDVGKFYFIKDTFFEIVYVANTYSTFLIQNMFPVTQEYVECKYIKNKVEITVSNKLQEELIFKANKVLNLYKHGMKNIIFPDIDNIQKKLKK